LTRKELIEELGARCGITVTQAESILRNIQHIVYDKLRSREAVHWHGFGSFSVFEAKPTKRRNPRTGEMMQLPAHPRVKFQAGEELRRAVQ
jgi:nucleoid DNA-binding protein